MKSKVKDFFRRPANQEYDAIDQVVLCKRAAKVPKLFLTVSSPPRPQSSLFSSRQKRRQMRQVSLSSSSSTRTASSAEDLHGSRHSLTDSLTPEDEPRTFEEYTGKLEELLIVLRDMKREDYESTTASRVLRFLENLIHQPKEWISGAKLKLSEMRFSETAMTLMNSYKEKGYLVRQAVFVHSILLYNSMSNFTDHEFDKEGLIRKQSAEAGFIEFACGILSDSSYRESLTKCYIITSPEEIVQSVDFNNYQVRSSTLDDDRKFLFGRKFFTSVTRH